MSLETFVFWRYGKEYLQAYMIVSQVKENPIDLLGPKFFLLGHSIEASLKAFLLSRGFTQDQLKSKKYGHNLEVLLEESNKNGLTSLVPLVQDQINLVKLLNTYYSKKEFEYPKLGAKTLPYFSDIEEIATNLTHSIHGMMYPNRKLKL